MANHETRSLRRRQLGLRQSLTFILLNTVLVMPVQALMAGDPNGVPTDSPAQRINANTKQSPWAGVGSISVRSGVYSGVVIGSRQVLTAAHVVAGAAVGDISFNLNLNGDLSQHIAAKEVIIHPDYGKHSFQGIALNDLAVIQLAADLPSSVPRYPLLVEALPIGTVISLVGYGASGNGLRGVTVSSNPNVKRAGKNVLDAFAPPPKIFEIPQAYLFDFDGPNVINTLGGVSLGNAVETSVASGDSGGPALVSIDGQWRVAGINTFQMSLPQRPAAPLFGSLGGGMFVPSYADWIHMAMAKPAAAATQSDGNLWLSGFVGVIGLVWARRVRREV